MADKWTGEWKFQPQPYDSPSKRALRWLRFACEVFRNAGATPPSSGRLENARRLLERIEGQPLRDATPRALREIAEANRMAWEFFVIAYAVNEVPAMRSPESLQRIRDMMLGGPLPVENKSKGRDTQFELYVGALLALSGFGIEAAEPDYRVDLGEETVGIACKRLRSLKHDKLRERLDDALYQITGSRADRESDYASVRVVRGRGLIAVNLDVYFEPVDKLLGDDALVALFDEQAAPAFQSAEQFKADHALLGILLFGHVSAWVFPDDTSPTRLAHRMPIKLITMLDPGVETTLLKPLLSSLIERSMATIRRLQQA